MCVLDLFEILNSAGFVLQGYGRNDILVRMAHAGVVYGEQWILVSEVSHNLPNVRA